jgi:hypothetical protein
VTLRSRRTWIGLAAAVRARPGALELLAGYVLRSAWYQAELLGSRVPIEKARKQRTALARAAGALDRVADVKAFGREIGSSHEELRVRGPRLESGNLERERLCAAALPLEDVVVPDRGACRISATSNGRRPTPPPRAAREGLDVYVRETGAYSTLGWFRDPILPSMLRWSEFDLADTILHELATPRCGVKGSVAFNESFASFVGEEGAFRYLDRAWTRFRRVSARRGSSRRTWRPGARCCARLYAISTPSYSRRLALRRSQAAAQGRALRRAARAGAGRALPRTGGFRAGGPRRRVEQRAARPVPHVQLESPVFEKLLREERRRSARLHRPRARGHEAGATRSPL